MILTIILLVYFFAGFGLGLSTGYDKGVTESLEDLHD